MSALSQNRRNPVTEIFAFCVLTFEPFEPQFCERYVCRS